MLLLASGAFYGLTTSPTFALDPTSVEVEGLRYTDPVAARQTLGLKEGEHPNMFHLPTARLEAALMTLPTVRAASVQARLPAKLHVAVEERVPILVWQRAGTEWLVDVDGVIFAQAPPGHGAPLVDDQRALAATGASEATWLAGARVSTLDLEVARVLGAVTAGDLAPNGSSLDLTVSDSEGWVMTSDAGWRALFGHYAPGSRPPASIQQQLTCLRALLHSMEGGVAEVTLSLSDDACGTFLPRATPTDAPTGRRGGATPSVSP